jgi:hypothetical protein
MGSNATYRTLPKTQLFPHVLGQSTLSNEGDRTMRRFFAVAMSSVVALVGFAGVANASATIDLIWDDTGTNGISSVAIGDHIQLNVILTAGPNGSTGAMVSVDYSGVLGMLVVVGYANTPSAPELPVDFGTTPVDTGDRIEGIISSASPFVNLGIGLPAGQSHQLGTVTFHNIALNHGVFEIQSDANGPADAVGDNNDPPNNITATTTFNSAFVDGGGDPPGCTSPNNPAIMQIEVNALRAGGKTIVTSPSNTTKVTAKARILKGTALSGTTIDTTLTITAKTGGEVIDQQVAPQQITLGVGKGGKGDTLLLSTGTCVDEYIILIAEFRGFDVDGGTCVGTRELRKACR